MDTIQLEWLNENSLRAYPIREDCSRIPHDQYGNLLGADMSLPNYVVVDFLMSVPSESSPNAYLKKLAYAQDFLNITFGVGDETVASVAVDITTHTANKAYPFIGQGSYEAAEGVVVVGDLSRLAEDFPEGQYYFTYEQAALEATCVRPSARGVTSFSIVDGATGYVQRKLYGDIRLVSGSNIELKYDEDSGSIVINAGNGLGYSAECDCGGIAQKVIRYINGVTADSVQIAGDECVAVSTSNGVITISNTCSKPCCGCNELAFINDKISEIQTAIARIESLASQLSAHRASFDAIDALDKSLGGTVTQ